MAAVDLTSNQTVMIHKGHRVRAWIYSNDQFSDFQRIAVEDEEGGYDLSQLGEGECLLNPGVVYRKRPK